MEFVRKGGNLYCEGSNLWQQLSTYRLPAPKVKTETHMAGGSRMDLEVPVGAIQPLTLGFNTISANPILHGGMGLSLSQAKLWTIYELLVDERSGVKRERIVTMRGIYQSAEADEMKGRGLKGYAHTITSIINYEDVIEGYGIVARFDYFTNFWQGYGIENDNQDNAILRITG